MSFVDMYSNTVRRKKDEIAKLKKDKIKYVSIISDCSSKIIRAKQQINGTKSQSTLKSKLTEISREEKRKSDAEKRISEYDKKIATKEKELYNEEAKLLREQDKEAKMQQRKYNESINSLNRNIELQKNAQLELSNEVNKLKEAKEKISILFIGANPTLNLDLEKEAREIRESIIKSLNRDSINFETRWATRTTDLFQYINEVSPTIIHFSGHGTENGELIFQDNNDNPKYVSREAITEMIYASTDDVRLVVFNNCYSSIIAESVVEKIESAIGMSISIGDDAAIQFASQLYSSIGFGLSLEKAFNQAIVSLKLEGINEVDTPQLYLNENFRASDIYLVTKVKD
ncbi:MAG: CHAT domain-containing protein [Bacilli bacterium]